MRIGGYYIEVGLSSYDYLSVTLLSVLWFLAIFAFRVGRCFSGTLAPIEFN